LIDKETGEWIETFDDEIKSKFDENVFLGIIKK